MTTIGRRVRRRGKPTVAFFPFIFYSAYLVHVYCLSAILKSSAPLEEQASEVSTAPLEQGTEEYAPLVQTCRGNGTIRQPPSVPGVSGQPCRYEGHCGIGTTCVSVSDTTTASPGTCVKYLTLPSAGSISQSSECAKLCLAALGPNIVLDSVHTSARNTDANLPDGCAILFRQNGPAAALEDRTIVRVDPILLQGKTAEESNVWMALCYEPCNDTGRTCQHNGFVCQEGVCQRDEAYWNPPSQRNEMVIVTGATSSGTNEKFFRGLTNLAGSINHWAPKQKIVIYNLGMKEEHLKEVESWDNVLEVKWRNGMPQHYPSHLRRAKAYAWKPIAINESLHEYKQIFWVDAGSTIAAPIDPIIRVTQQTGIFLVQGQDDSMRLSHRCAYDAFGYDKDSFRGGPHYSGNTQAYLYPSKYVDTVVIPNAQCALQPECIMPTGSGLHNHRYDQTSLSILAYRDDLRIPHYTHYLAAAKNQLEENLKFKPSKRIVWTSRGRCSDFRDEVPRKVVEADRLT